MTAVSRERGAAKVELLQWIDRDAGWQTGPCADGLPSSRPFRKASGPSCAAT